jgi:hypothetical protein
VNIKNRSQCKRGRRQYRIVLRLLFLFTGKTNHYLMQIQHV